jgi:cellulose biosynthesis protein BcsQ
MMTLTVAAPKGGSGKTTVALLLAVHGHAQHKGRVALFDLNADQANVAQWRVLRRERAGPAIIEVENLVEDVKALAHSGRFDLLVIDTPPSIDDGALVEAAVAVSDAVLIPARPSILDVGAMPAIVEMCQQRRKPHAFVLCDATASWGALNTKAEAALKEMAPVLASRLTHRLAYVNALTAGKVGSEMDSTCKAEAAALWGDTMELFAQKGRRHG